MVAGVPAGLWERTSNADFLCWDGILNTGRLKYHIVQMAKPKSKQELGRFDDTESVCSAGSMASPQLLSPFLWKRFWLSYVPADPFEFNQAPELCPPEC